MKERVSPMTAVLTTQAIDARAGGASERRTSMQQSSFRLVSFVLFALVAAITPTGLVSLGHASDFDEDIRRAETALSSLSDESNRTKAMEVLAKYQDARARVLANLLEQLTGSDIEETRSSWNSQAGNGASALSSLSGDMPSDAKDKLRDFVENEKQLWEHLRESPGYLFSRHQIIGLRAKTEKERVRLDDKWKNIEREDAALDAAIYNLQNEGKNNLRQAVVQLSGLVGRALEQAGLEGARLAGEAIKVAGEKYLRAREVLVQETAIWQTFINEREVARRIHEEISPDRIDKAMDYASRLSVSGDSKDYRTFKDRAIRILEGHRDKAREEYAKFMSENKGRFIESLETSWFLILIDQKEVDEWKEFFQLQTGDLKSLLESHEQGFTNLEDSDLKRAFKENLDRMMGSSREMMTNWQAGKEIYDRFERELKR